MNRHQQKIDSLLRHTPAPEFVNPAHQQQLRERLLREHAAQRQFDKTGHSRGRLGHSGGRWWTVPRLAGATACATLLLAGALTYNLLLRPPQRYEQPGTRVSSAEIADAKAESAAARGIRAELGQQPGDQPRSRMSPAFGLDGETETSGKPAEQGELLARLHEERIKNELSTSTTVQLAAAARPDGDRDQAELEERGTATASASRRESQPEIVAGAAGESSARQSVLQEQPLAGDKLAGVAPEQSAPALALVYDPSNGTRSEGDVYHINQDNPEWERRLAQQQRSHAAPTRSREIAPTGAGRSGAGERGASPAAESARRSFNNLRSTQAHLSSAPPQRVAGEEIMQEGLSAPAIAEGEERKTEFDFGAKDIADAQLALRKPASVQQQPDQNAPAAIAGSPGFSRPDVAVADGETRNGRLQSTPAPMRHARGRLENGTKVIITLEDGTTVTPDDVEVELLHVWREPDHYYRRTANTEDYDHIEENEFLDAAQNPLSTFSIDADTAAYANVRRFLNHYQLPPKGAVRLEEMINYFDYGYAPPEDAAAPFAAHLEVATCPWRPEHRLVRIALKAREIDWDKRPATNLVFLIDVSGSMSPPNKLPLLKDSLKMLTRRLSETDHVGIVTYAGAAGEALPPTGGDRQTTILEALERLKAGGSTNGGAGIQLAYQMAVHNFVEGGINRVILCTDGDLNVGVTNRSDLIDLIQRNAKSGVFLTVLGFGTGNLKDATLEQLADKGNGSYHYIDSPDEAQKIMSREIMGTLYTVAKDVKIQVEFNPQQARSFRLLGYENRKLHKEDFNDDTKDAGEIGAGHSVTALYEVVPANGASGGGVAAVDELKYQDQLTRVNRRHSHELLTVKVRYKEPDGETSKRLEFPLVDGEAGWQQAGEDFQFAAAVAAFGMLLRDSAHKGDATFAQVRELARFSSRAGNVQRAEFIELVERAAALSDE